MGLLESISGVTKLATQIANPDLLREVSKANVQALELSETNLELQKRIIELETQLRELQTRRDLAKTLFRNGDFVYRDGDPGGCCPRCWDAEQKLIHIFLSRSDGAQCPNCKTLYIILPGINPGRHDQFSVPV